MWLPFVPQFEIIKIFKEIVNKMTTFLLIKMIQTYLPKYFHNSDPKRQKYLMKNQLYKKLKNKTLW